MNTYDPNLKEAMVEMMAVMKKHDIGGYIQLVSPTHSEFGLEITPTWSCAHWEDKDNGILRFRAKQSELGREEAHNLIEKTCHLIFQMRDLSALGFSYADKMAKLIETQVKVEHAPFKDFTPHREQ